MFEHNPRWTFGVPLAAGLVLVLSQFLSNGLVTVLLVAGLVGCVAAAVHHAEVIAHRVGEPFGTLVLALSVTVIEVALIVSMMLSGGADAMALPRDTIFAAVMIILNAIIGLSLVVGGRKHGEQIFNVEGMTDALCTMAAIIVLALVVPNYTFGATGPVYSPLQLGFVAAATLALFAAFTLFQTVLHRDYFISAPAAAPASEPNPAVESHAAPDTKTALVSLGMLVLSLVGVVLSAKGISPTLEALLGRWGAPAATLGIIIAAIVLLPEFGAAMRAAQRNRLQTSLNLAIGSAIASIGLTIPVVAVLAIIMGWPLELGLSPLDTVLLVLSLFVVALTLRTGKTTLQPGITLLVLFGAYLFFSFVP